MKDFLTGSLEVIFKNCVLAKRPGKTQHKTKGWQLDTPENLIAYPFRNSRAWTILNTEIGLS